MRKENPPN